jgi:hypothetical protein
VDVTFRNQLPNEELEEVEKYFLSLSFNTIEQHPRWKDAIGVNEKFTYVLARDKGLKAFAIVAERDYRILKTARISFGPLFSDPDSLIETIIAIQKHYKASGFSYLAIQLAMPTGPAADYVEYKVNREFPVEYVFDRYNWSSLTIDLTVPADDIFRRFSKGHKSAIKKAVTDGTVTRKLTSSSEVDQFAKVFVKMQEVRNLSGSGLDETELQFNHIHDFLTKGNLGFFLGVYDKSDVMAGGIIVIYQGDTARYYKGASDPTRKDIAVLHLAIFEALKISADAGRKVFDLWGYNHMVDEQDQVFFINRFKKGFSDTFLFYPKMMHISLSRGGYALYKAMMKNRDRLSFLKKFVKKG